MKILALTAGAVVAFIVIVLSLPAGANAPDGRYRVDAGTVYDTKTLLTWQQSAPDVAFDQATAKSYCSILSLNGRGWRVPTIKELQTLFDPSQTTSPTIDGNAFPNTPVSDFWSASPAVGSLATAWALDFSLGICHQVDASQMLHLRCVR